MMNGNNIITRRELFKEINQILKNSKIDTPETEACFIMEYIFKKNIGYILMDRNMPVTSEIINQAYSICNRRIQHYPLQYIFGEWEFYGIPLEIGEGVLIPRADTEILVDTVCSLRSGMKETKLLDLCSGSGCIPIAISSNLPNVSGYALENDYQAFEYLKKNLEKHAPKIIPFKCDVIQRKTAERFSGFDIITCNPPYLTTEDMECLQKEVTFEPEVALFGGDDGLFFYKYVTKLWKDSLYKGGYLVYEIGKGQEIDVTNILKQNGFENIQYFKDFNSIIRVITASSS